MRPSFKIWFLCALLLSNFLIANNSLSNEELNHEWVKVNHNVGLFSQMNCSLLEVDISTPCLKRCVENTYYVKYCNSGIEIGEDAFVEIELDSLFSFISATLPVGAQVGQVLTFELGDIEPGDCGSFEIVIDLSCDATLGASHCMIANIFPDTLCTGPGPNWDGSSIEVETICQGDSTLFQIQNTGNGDMLEEGSYIIIVDDIILNLDEFQLNSGEAISFLLPTQGGTVYFEAEQSPGHPGLDFPTNSLEGCTDLGNNYTIGFIPNYAQNDMNPFVDVTCLENTDDCIFNNKIAFPKGWTEEHYINANQALEYQINFQNITSDSIGTLQICDTLSPFLDLTTLQAGASSHPYEVLTPGANVVKFIFENIELPDSSSNYDASFGFVKFTVFQNPDNLPGTLIENNATIIFDNLQSINTETIFHQIPDLEEMTVVHDICEGDTINGIAYSFDTTLIHQEATFSLFSYVDQTEINVTPPIINQVEASICEGESYFFQGQFLSETGTYSEMFTSFTGCDSLEILELEVLENEDIIGFGTACPGEFVEFEGFIFSEPGLNIEVVNLPNGCFQIIIFELEQLPASMMEEEASICSGDVYEWEGQILDIPNEYEVNYPNIFGCDSTLTLDLEVFDSIPPNNLVETICEGETFQVGNSTYFLPGFYVDTLSSFSGCDSIIMLELSLDFPSDTILIEEIFEGESVMIGNQIFNETGIYFPVIPNEAGCDSLITLYLFVLDAMCTPFAGNDTLICGYEHLLEASPTGGIWETICDLAPGMVEMEIENDSSIHVTVSECGEYLFTYTYTEIDTSIYYDPILMDTVTVIDTCISSDLVEIFFEDPSLRILDLDVNISIVYNDYDCPGSDTVFCNNSYAVPGLAPDVTWKFEVNGDCISIIYGNTIGDTLTECLVQEIDVFSLSSSGSIDSVLYCIDQDDFVTIDSLTLEILQNNFLNFFSSFVGQGIVSLADECPEPPPGCFETPSSCLEFDTIDLILPIHLGGQWTIIDENDVQIYLEDTTAFSYDDETYAIVVLPHHHYYNAQFQLHQLDTFGNLNYPANTVPVTFQWEELWAYDTITYILPVLQPGSDCVGCERGTRISVSANIPSIPGYDCGPFTILFNKRMIVTHDIIECNENDYIVQITMECGKPPYSVSGLSGNFISTFVFVSDPIPISSNYQATINDSSFCEESIGGDPCSCIGLFSSTESFIEMSCDDPCVTLEAFGGANNNSSISMQWCDDFGNIIGTGPVVVVCEPGFYTFKVTGENASCFAASSTLIEVFLPQADAGLDKVISCNNPAINLDGQEVTGMEFIQYFWTGPGINAANQNEQSPSVAVGGLYYLTITNALTGCTDEDVVLVEEDFTEPEVDAGVDDILDCIMTTLTLDGTNSTNQNVFSIEWSTLDGNILSGNNTINPIVNMPGTYILTIKLNNGCEASDEVLVEVYPSIVFDFESSASCWNEVSGQIEIQNPSGGMFPFTYSIDGLNYQEDPIFSDLEAGIYNIYVQDINGCANELAIEVDLIPELPEIQLADSFHICGPNPGLEIDLNANFTSEYFDIFWSNDQIEWNNTFHKTGDYSVEISSPCESQVLNFHVKDDLDEWMRFQMPNAFSPNNDGTNDLFRPISTLPPVPFEFKIFDRWGNQIYRANQNSTGWDGNYKGKPMPTDVYVWFLNATIESCEGEQKDIYLEGEVTLLR